MRRATVIHLVNLCAEWLGFALFLIACALSIVTLASSDYRGLLIAEMAFAIGALVCLSVLALLGPMAWRIVTVLFAAPVLWVFFDFARRGPHAFGWYMKWGQVTTMGPRP